MELLHLRLIILGSFRLIRLHTWLLNTRLLTNSRQRWPLEGKKAQNACVYRWQSKSWNKTGRIVSLYKQLVARSCTLWDRDRLAFFLPRWLCMHGDSPAGEQSSLLLAALCTHDLLSPCISAKPKPCTGPALVLDRPACVHAVPTHRYIPGLIPCRMIASFSHRSIAARAAIHDRAVNDHGIYLPSADSTDLRLRLRRRTKRNLSLRPVVVPDGQPERVWLEPRVQTDTRSVLGSFYCCTNSSVIQLLVLIGTDRIVCHHSHDDLSLKRQSWRWRRWSRTLCFLPCDSSAR